MQFDVQSYVKTNAVEFHNSGIWRDRLKMFIQDEPTPTELEEFFPPELDRRMNRHSFHSSEEHREPFDVPWNHKYRGVMMICPAACICDGYEDGYGETFPCDHQRPHMFGHISHDGYSCHRQQCEGSASVDMSWGEHNVRCIPVAEWYDLRHLITGFDMFKTRRLNGEITNYRSGTLFGEIYELYSDLLNAYEKKSYNLNTVLPTRGLQYG